MVRFKRRYLLFRIDWSGPPCMDVFKCLPKLIYQEIEKRFGDFGAGLSSNQIVSLC